MPSMCATLRRARGRRRGETVSGPTLRVFSREDAEAFVPEGKAVCISITDPGSPPANLGTKFADVLRLSFHDIGDDVPPGTKTDRGLAQHMGVVDAGEIVRFAARHADADVLVVHCEAGVNRRPRTWGRSSPTCCRSRSVAEALFDAFGRRAPNQYVYRRIVDAFYRNFYTLPERWIDFRWSPKRRGPR